jgi:hypothetical protein
VKLRSKAAFIAIQTAAALLLLEAGLRFLTPRVASLRMMLHRPGIDQKLYEVDSLAELMSRTSIGFRPNTEFYGFVLNSRGLRTTEYHDTKDPGSYRVLTFGDSFTFASGGLAYEDHWTTLLEIELDGRSEQPVEVLNFGISATGPIFQYRLWQIEGSRLDADLVVVAFFVGNDFNHPGAHGVGRGEGSSLSDRVAHSVWTWRLVRNLYRVKLGVDPRARPSRGSSSGHHEKGGFPIAGYKKTFDDGVGSLTPDKFLEIERRRMALCADNREDRFESLLRKTVATLTEFRDDVAAHGGRFVVMIIPDQYQVDPAIAEAVADHYGRPLSDYDLGRPQRRLAEELAAADTEHLDLLPSFREAQMHRPVYRPRDTHWNREGNILAAGELAAFLVEGSAL